MSKKVEVKKESVSFLTKNKVNRNLRNKKKSYNESVDYQAQRHNKISFKKYLEELEEDFLEADLEIEEEE